MNLAVITELPLVVINVQRGGPSTGLPTKSEQTDLLQALFGRNGESPMRSLPQLLQLIVLMLLMMLVRLPWNT